MDIINETQEKSPRRPPFKKQALFVCMCCVLGYLILAGGINNIMIRAPTFFLTPLFFDVSATNTTNKTGEGPIPTQHDEILEASNLVSHPPPHLSSYCYKSPYFICSTPSLLSKQKPREVWNIKSNGKSPLVVTTLFNSNLYLTDEMMDFRDCPYPCVFKPRQDLNLSEAKGVLVDGVCVTKRHVPNNLSERPVDQIYIMTGVESPVHYRGIIKQDHSELNDQINLVSTYRVDSDIPDFYNRLCLNENPRKTQRELGNFYARITEERLRSKVENMTDTIYKGKTVMAAWFVSNCNTQSKRMKYVKELQKYINVDIFGRCGKDRKKTQYGSDSEKELLTTKYKFYLSFENSMCQDYVTEKFFKVFDEGVYVVPVVRGGANYKKYFPPRTFIDVADFKSPKDLGNYLKNVASDPKKYINFLENRDVYRIIPAEYQNRLRMCNLCTMLHVGGGSVLKRYSNINDWLMNGTCYTPKDI